MQRADEMSEEGGLARTLQEITDATMPAPRYVKYHERHLQRHLSLLGNYPPRCRPQPDCLLVASRWDESREAADGFSCHQQCLRMYMYASALPWGR